MNVRHSVCVALIILTGTLHCQSNQQDLDETFFDSPTLKLQHAIVEVNRRQAIFAYILANAATPGIDLVAILPPDLQRELLANVPKDADPRTFVIEFVQAKIGENKSRQYIQLFKSKNQIFKTIISKGQK